MEVIDWTPKGGDGASSADESEIVRQVDDAVAVFYAMAKAIVDGEIELARVTWERFVDRVADTTSPYGLFVQAGIITTAVAIRAYGGDPDPAGPPSSEVQLLAVARSRATGEIVDMDEADLAATVVGLACNWEWDKLNELMLSTVEQGLADTDFLQNLGSVLMTMFVGVGGLESTARRG